MHALPRHPEKASAQAGEGAGWVWEGGWATVSGDTRWGWRVLGDCWTPVESEAPTEEGRARAGPRWRVCLCGKFPGWLCPRDRREQGSGEAEGSESRKSQRQAELEGGAGPQGFWDSGARTQRPWAFSFLKKKTPANVRFLLFYRIFGVDPCSSRLVCIRLRSPCLVPGTPPECDEF